MQRLLRKKEQAELDALQQENAMAEKAIEQIIESLQEQPCDTGLTCRLLTDRLRSSELASRRIAEASISQKLNLLHAYQRENALDGLTNRLAQEFDRDRSSKELQRIVELTLRKSAASSMT